MSGGAGILLGLLAILLGLVGGRLARDGARQADAGRALRLESSTLEHQLAHDADHVIARTKLGAMMEQEGRASILRGLRAVRVGIVCAIGSVIVSVAAILT